MNINDVQRRGATPKEISQAKKEGFIFGKMSANTQADQVAKMKYSHEQAAKKRAEKAKKKGKEIFSPTKKKGK